jgi:hypothetical protein
MVQRPRFRTGPPAALAVAVLSVFAVTFTDCGKPQDRPRAPYLPLATVEATYGQLVTAGNHPTADQHGTGERVGIFRDAAGTVWGLPLTVENSGAVLACAPPGLRDAKSTGTLPSGSTVIGATNEPTGWRGGTGGLELLLRGADGAIRSLSVQSAALENGPGCWAPESPGPAQRLHYYRLTPTAASR